MGTLEILLRLFVLRAMAQEGEVILTSGSELQIPDDPTAVIGSIYNFALLGAGLLAFLMIVHGAVRYSVAGGNSSIKTDARDQITQALFGLLVLLGMFFIVSVVNPNLTRLSLPDLEEIRLPAGAIFVGGGSCEPNTAYPPSKLVSAFGSEEVARQASSIINIESGGDPTALSMTDKCKDGNSFSVGLFQVNMIAHKDKIAECNQNIFEVNGGGTQGACLKRVEGICFQYDCKVADQKAAAYGACKAKLMQESVNINVAAQIYRSGGWGQWGANRICGF